MIRESSAGDASDLAWFKSSYSSSEGDSCVEIATTPATIHVRDSKNPANGPTFRVTPATWAAFTTCLK